MYRVLHQCFSILADNPRLGRDVSHLKADYRRHQYEQHAVYYQITKTGVLITRILGPGQDPAKNVARIFLYDIGGVGCQFRIIFLSQNEKILCITL